MRKRHYNGSIHNSNWRHGRNNTPEHKIWIGMRQRCLNPKNQDYTRYGGRGIKISLRWMTFEHFFTDMGKRPSKNHSLDRKNNDGDYTPKNCRWATLKQQANNKSQYDRSGENNSNATLSNADCSKITLKIAIAEWSIEDVERMFGVHRSTVYHVLRRRLKT